MTVSHLAALRTTIAAAVLAAIDSGTAGNLVYRTSGDVEVATLALSAVSGVVSGAVLTFNTISDDTSATGGTVAKATIEDSAAGKQLTCSVTATGGGGDIELSSLSVGAGDTVQTSSLTYTAPV